MQALESHSFEPVKMLQWRNTELDFASLGALQASLAETPEGARAHARADRRGHPGARARGARRRHPRAAQRRATAVERLWEVCQVPDYRKIAPATHAELAATLYGFLMREGTNPRPTGSPARSRRRTTTDGDIDTLSNRIAHIRTWTFVANRPDWLADPEHWQGVTRARRGQAVRCAARAS